MSGQMLPQNKKRMISTASPAFQPTNFSPLIQNLNRYSAVWDEKACGNTEAFSATKQNPFKNLVSVPEFKLSKCFDQGSDESTRSTRVSSESYPCSDDDEQTRKSTSFLE